MAIASFIIPPYLLAAGAEVAGLAGAVVADVEAAGLAGAEGVGDDAAGADVTGADVLGAAEVGAGAEEVAGLPQAITRRLANSMRPNTR